MDFKAIMKNKIIYIVLFIIFSCLHISCSKKYDVIWNDYRDDKMKATFELTYLNQNYNFNVDRTKKIYFGKNVDFNKIYISQTKGLLNPNVNFYVNNRENIIEFFIMNRENKAKSNLIKLQKNKAYLGYEILFFNESLAKWCYIYTIKNVFAISDFKINNKIEKIPSQDYWNKSLESDIVFPTDEIWDLNVQKIYPSYLVKSRSFDGFLLINPNVPDLNNNIIFREQLSPSFWEE